ncbi:MAG TPA: helix-turn-helix domain-containing protein [Terriglobales bacterium]|jgi:predicted transcriptional regulator|nr:helix-turn-helix domain-containing protein [Terriglobales bacterium]
MTRRRGNKTSRAVREQRTAKALALVAAGYKMKDIARMMRISRDALRRYLRAAEGSLGELNQELLAKFVEQLIQNALRGDIKAALRVLTILDRGGDEDDEDTNI